MRVALPDFTTLSAARRSLRACLNAHRRQVPPQQRAHISQLVAQNVDRSLRLRSGWRIALYAALPWELDAAPLIALAESRGCRVFLPRIDRRRASSAMRFVPRCGPWRYNRLGIAEPQGSESLGARWLEVVFLPLVGFDRRGVRLGTGGGFYDRAFAFRHLRQVWHAPRLVGLAYAFQEVDRIEAAAHDVLMDAVVTEEGVIRCTTG
ncbi:MAG TPA: 5-formyltetrahydrofolate cyclo-ligase [Steroidobacteraceae bacterium]|nr:5-formyltetrahydrofolate cyclo-ligase [Steroidobacteraceae bacterium]